MASFQSQLNVLPASTALPTDQMQSNKLPNKSIKYAKILFQIKQIQNRGFEIAFDIFDT